MGLALDWGWLRLRLGFGEHTRPSTGMWFLVLKRPIVAKMPMAATIAATGRDQEVLRAFNCSMNGSVREEELSILGFETESKSDSREEVQAARAGAPCTLTA